MAKVARPQDLLFAVSFRLPATEAINILEETATQWPACRCNQWQYADASGEIGAGAFAIAAQECTFSRSLAAPVCLAQALTVALAARLQRDHTPPRIPVVTGA